MGNDLNGNEPVEVAMVRLPASFAVVETVSDERRILFLTDDWGVAHEIATELRRRGVWANACPTVTPT